MCDGNVLEYPLCTNNGLALDCQDYVNEVLEDDCGFKMHNLQDSIPSSSCNCLTEPDCVFVGNEGLFIGGCDPTSETLYDVVAIDIKCNAAIEWKAEKGSGEDFTEAFTFNGNKTDCSC